MRRINDGVQAPKEATLASHMPILIELFDRLQILWVLEFGCGIYSTRLFLSKAPHVASLESQHEEWLAHVRGVLKDHFAVWHSKFVPIDQAVYEAEKVIAGAALPDLIFVDGTDRVRHCQWAFGKTDLVVLHDSQKRFHDEIQAPERFAKIVFRQFPVWYGTPDGEGLEDRPWTTVWAATDSPKYAVVQEIAAMEPGLYEKHKFPYFPTELPSIGIIQ